MDKELMERSPFYHYWEYEEVEKLKEHYCEKCNGPFFMRVCEKCGHEM